jgi:Shedu protein SduA, C-terminal
MDSVDSLRSINLSSDFIVGQEDFSRLEIRDSHKNNFHYFYDSKLGRLIKQFVLEDKPRVATLCEVTLIKKDGKFTPRLRLWKRDKTTKKTSDIKLPEKDQYKVVKAAVALDDCHENFWLLINYLSGIKDIDVPKARFSLINAVDRDFVQKVVTSFQTPAEQKLLVEAKKDDINNLYAAIAHAKNKHALVELEGLIKEDATELRFQEWFQNNTWAFGVDYLEIYDTSRIGLHSDSDFIARSLDQYADLIELKRPSMNLLVQDTSHNNYYPSADLSKAIGQAVHYLQTMENQRMSLQEEDEITVLKPRIKLIAGLTNQFDAKQKQALRLINNGLHGIEIISYDQVVARAKKLIAIYSSKGQLKP